jgi:PAS domain S-box-containing protein
MESHPNDEAVRRENEDLRRTLREAEEALRLSEERHQLMTEKVSEVLDLNQKIINASTLGIIAFRADGQCILANPAVARISGAELEQMLRINFRDLSVWKEYGLLQRAETALKTKTGQRDEVYLRTSFGRKSWLSYSMTTFTSGGDLHLLMVVDDVSDRKKTEASLLESESRYRTLFESSKDGIVSTDMQGHITEANRAYREMLGYSKDEVLLLTYQQLTPIQWHAMEDEVLRTQVLPRGYSDKYEKEYIRKDGSVFPIKVRTWLLQDETGANKGMWAIVRDITEEKRIDEERKRFTEDLKRSNIELEEFAYIASHDLREPLRKMINFSELLAKRYKGQMDEKADRCIWHITDGAARMNRLIDDLLEYSRVGRMEFPIDSVDMNEVLESVKKDLHVMIQESGAVLTSHALPTIQAVPIQMAQLLQNLIANAIKYRGNDVPHVQISATQISGEWQFEVQDNGIGIASEYHEQIFKIFQRLHSKDQYSGTGIGLAVCKRIVTRHKGRIWVDSHPGKGSTFVFTLPC